MDLGPDITLTPDSAEKAAKATLDSARNARVKACQEEVEAVLKKHSCTIDVSLLIKNGQLPIANLNIISLV